VYPKKSEYEVTPFGKTIIPLLAQIDAWGTANAAFVKTRQLELEKIAIG
jgi:DNA-binding HxlR family transcriptional regulator